MYDVEFAFITIIVLGLPMVIIYNLKKKKSLAVHFLGILMTVYLTSVVAFTFFPIVADSRIIADYREAGLHISYNFVPFKSIIGSFNHSYYMVGIRNILGNFLLLLPLGFLISFLGINKVYNATIIGFLVSLSIEAVQLLLALTYLSSRSIDIDDLFLNTIGCMTGYLTFKVGKLIIPTHIRKKLPM